MVISLASCASTTTKPAQVFAAEQNSQTRPAVLSNNTIPHDWQILQTFSSAKLTSLQNQTNDPVQSGWIQLALLSKQRKISNEELANQIAAWQQHNPNHPGNELLPNQTALTQLQSAGPPHQIALLLPQNGPYHQAAQNIREGFLNAYYANPNKPEKQKIKFYDTSSKEINLVYQQAINDGADFIVGPLQKENVQQLNRLPHPVTTLALNYTDENADPHFYQFGLLPEDEVIQMVNRAKLANLSHAIIIAPQNAWGERLVTSFKKYWLQNGGTITDSLQYANDAHFDQDIMKLLHVNESSAHAIAKKNQSADTQQQRRNDFDVIFLFAKPKEARTIVPLLRFYYANHIPIYASSNIDVKNNDADSKMDFNDVIVCNTPWSIQALNKTGEQNNNQDPLYAVGQDAYLLSQSLTKLVNLPHFPIYGASGALTLSAQNQIHRRLPCMVIKNGLL